MEALGPGQGQLARHQTTEGPAEQMAFFRQDCGNLLRQPRQSVLTPLVQRAVAKPGQVHQVQPIVSRQLLGNTVPDSTIHAPAMQQHQVLTLAKPLNRYVHLDSRSLFICLEPAC